jgi:hypothetical protein
MTWQTGTSDNYQTVLQDLIDVATSDHVATVAIDGGGAGYVVGDVLTVAGGTSTHAATLVVTSVAAGVIDGIRMGNGGAYTVDPTLSANAATGGTGAGATFDLTMDATGWAVDRREYRAARATISAGGTGYSVGNVLTVVGGTGSEVARFRVQTVSGGAVTSVAPLLRGSTTTTHDVSGLYTATPSNPVTTTGGAGTCTLTVEYEQELIMEGAGAGSDDITVGIRTFQDVVGFDTTYNWAVYGMASYSSSLYFFDQVNISPGFNTVPAADPPMLTAVGSYVPLRDTNGSFPITYWFNITPYRIIAVFKVRSGITTAYCSMYLGYVNGLGTTTEIPWPIFVAGCSHRRNVWYQDTTPYITGLAVMDGGGVDNGPAFIFRPVPSSWAGIQNADVNDAGVSRAADADSCIYPGGSPNVKPPASGYAAIATDGWGTFADVIPVSGIPGTQVWQIYPTPNTAGDLYWLIPSTIIDTDDNTNDFLPYGELDEVFWVSRGGTLTSEDTITVDGEVYRVFQCGNRTSEFSYMAIKETY